MLMLEKGKIGSLELKNRIIFAPMGVGTLNEYGDEGIAYYEARAKGGCGMLMTHAFILTPAEGGFPLEPLFPSMKKMADMMHSYGAAACMQVYLGTGRIARFTYALDAVELRESPVPSISASAVPDFGHEQTMTRELTLQEIKDHLETVRNFCRGFKETGYDAVELHAYGGYLMDQFLSARWNKRTDEYGGDVRGRAKLALDCIKIFKEELGQDFPVIVKYSPSHLVKEEGFRTLDEGIELAKIFEEAGVDMLHLDPGCYEVWEKMMPPIYQQQEVDDLKIDQIVKDTVSIPVAANGKLGYPERGEAALRQGKTDFLIIGRTLLADPDLPTKLIEGRPEEIKPCIGCNEGCIARVTHGGTSITCAVNAATGYEIPRKIEKAANPKKIIIVGAGPAGLAAAIDAHNAGHDVEIWEKTTRLGGLLNAAGRPVFKKEVADLVKYFYIQIAKRGIPVKYSTEATADNILAAGADEVILANGSRPIMPSSIPGIKGRNVVTAIDTLNDIATIGNEIAVIGSGLVGAETAVHLAQFGKNVKLIEMKDEIIPENVFYQNKKMLAEIVNSIDRIEVHTSTKLVRIEDDAIIVEKGGAESRIPCDTVVLAMGLVPNTELFEELEGKVSVTRIGDCIRARRVLEASAEAREAIVSINSR